MNMIKRFSLLGILFSIFSFPLFSFSEKNIISPQKGIWCNQQALVLSPDGASEIYYSISGSDPFESGFAYDRPILIEKKGDVRIRIGVVDSDGSKKEFNVDYTVMPPVLSGLENEARKFVEKKLLKMPLIIYKNGTKFSFPSGFTYSFNKKRKPFLVENLKLQSENSVERFASVFITDGLNNYHSVIMVVPAEKKSVAANGMLPYSIRNWENFSFNEKKFIYQIDDEMWNSDYSERQITRNQNHIVRWQSIDFANGNKVYESLVPVMPEIRTEKKADGKNSFFIIGDDGYTFENGERMMEAQAFYGEETSGNFYLEIFYKGNFSGILAAQYELDRLPPEKPVFIASENLLVSKKSIALKISSSSIDRIFYAVSAPVFFDSEKEIPSDDEINQPEEFTEYSGGDILIASKGKKSFACKVFAYAVDKSGNRSSIAEKKFVIDELNVYVGSSSENEKADGSYMHPFVSLNQAIESVNSSENGRKIHLLGDVIVNEGECVISKDCSINGNGANILMGDGSVLLINGVSVSINGCSIEKRGTGFSPVAKMNGGKITLDDCEIFAFYDESGKLFEFIDSDVSFKNSGFTVQSRKNSICAEFISSSLNVYGCRITAIGEKSEALKIKNSSCIFEKNLLTLFGSICRGIELTGGSISFAGDVFDSRSDGKYRNSGAFFRNGNCKVSGFESLTARGF